MFQARAALIPWLLSILLTWSTSTIGFVQARPGVQCPTAPIQTIESPVYSCCHKLLGYVSRSVQPGDKGFVQCKCAEKKAAQTAVVFSPKVDLWIPHLQDIQTGEKLISESEPCSTEQMEPKECDSAPSVPPPLAA